MHSLDCSRQGRSVVGAPLKCVNCAQLYNFSKCLRRMESFQRRESSKGNFLSYCSPFFLPQVDTPYPTILYQAFCLIPVGLSLVPLIPSYAAAARPEIHSLPSSLYSSVLRGFFIEARFFSTCHFPSSGLLPSHFYHNYVRLSLENKSEAYLQFFLKLLDNQNLDARTQHELADFKRQTFRPL